MTLAAWQEEIVSAGELYRVGGAVRDRLLGVPDVVDSDFLVRGITPTALESLLERHGKWSRVGKIFGVYKFTPRGARDPIDIVLPRTESSTGVGHRDFEVRFDWTLPVEADLGRRDFTINAIAERVPDGRVVDPFGGAGDVAARVLRMIFPQAFAEDPLRILRGARFAARFDLSVDEATRAAMAASSELLPTVSAERVQDELTRTLTQCPKPSAALDLLHGIRGLGAWLPELERCAGVAQNEFHPDDVYWHSLKTCDAAPRANLSVRWAALLHDVGKVDTRQRLVEEGNERIVFYGHEAVGADLAQQVLVRLRYPKDFVAACRHLVREHMFRYETSWSDAAVRRFMRRVGEGALDDLLALREADCRSRDLSLEIEKLEELRARIDSERRARATLTVAHLAVDGSDVMAAAKMDAGPEVGATLAYLLERVTEDPHMNTRDRLIELVRERKKSGDVRGEKRSGRERKSRKPA